MVTGPAIASRLFRRRRLTGILLAVLLALTFALISIRVSITETGKRLELHSFDWRLRWARQSFEASEVVVVHLDKNTIDRFPDTGWPIPRMEYARFIDTVMRCGARTVVLDILFAFPDKHGPENDREFAAVLEQYAKNIVLATNLDIDEDDNPPPPWWNLSGQSCAYIAAEGYCPLEQFACSARLGHVEVVPDLDGVNRRVPLVLECEGRCTPSLSLAAAMAFLGIPEDEIQIAGSDVHVGQGHSSLRIPVDTWARLLPRSMARLRTDEADYSFEQFAEPARSGRGTENEHPLRSIVDGKIVLLGMGDIMELRIPTPGQVLANGVDVHAAFVDNILSGGAARVLPLSQKLPLVFLLTLAAALCTLFLPPGRSLPVILAGVAGYLALTILLLPTTGIVLPVMTPALGVVLSIVSVNFGRLVTGERWRAAEEREIQRARAIQRMLLPKANPAIRGVDLFGSLEPCLDVAGDSYDYFSLGENQLAVSIGDVSGKGLHAAMLMSNIQGRLRAEAGYLKTPARVMAAVNDALSSVVESTSYATMAYAVINIEEKLLTSCLAGHCRPIVSRADGSVEWLSAGGPPVGMFSGVTYEEEEIRLGPGDAVVFYTDGITEAAAPSGIFFEEERLSAAIKTSPRGDAEGLARSVLGEVRRFTDQAQAADDRTILVLKLPLVEHATEERSSTANPEPRGCC